ncbi:hypothetical protein J1792_31360 [Streptomyces triculaminicus]|uniref:Uncharacterized protein n=2 Tax=Streptomyces TaxID=1883 RepID=A0A939JTM3_9ACTN|nr:MULTISPECIES: hypothetical protein [Streptomyces]MBO0657072.1 hypothetical protein [Streptomyces triculaminicus]QSY49538.1 hypothetical protein J3S04_32415 [Streptomyces griseocarneus]
MNNNPLDRVRKNKAPHCERHHAHLTPERRAEAAAWFPVGRQAQMAFLLVRYDNNVPVLAAVLGTSGRAVCRYARGGLLPPGPRLRRALRRRVLDLVCPGCLADRAVEEARQAERDVRRAARRSARGRDRSGR